MLRILGHKKRAVEIDVREFEPQRDMKYWIDCHEPKPEELQFIAKTTNIPFSVIKSTLDEEERPRVEGERGYSITIFKVPYESEDWESFTVPVIIIQSGNYFVTIQLRNTDSIDKIFKKAASGAIDIFEEGSHYKIYRIIKQAVRGFFLSLDTIEKKIDLIEDAILANTKENLSEQIFRSKKRLIYFHKALVANREVIMTIEGGFLGRLQPKDRQRYRAVYNDIVQLIDVAGTHRDILTGALDFYLANASNRLNEIMYKLTLIAALFVIPTVVSSIYGMNIDFLPFSKGPHSFTILMTIMIVFTLTALGFFRIKKWI